MWSSIVVEGRLAVGLLGCGILRLVQSLAGQVSQSVADTWSFLLYPEGIKGELPPS